MADNNTVLVDNLEEKISILVDRYLVLKTKVNELSLQNEKLKEELHKANDKCFKLEETYNTLKVSKVLEVSGSDASDAKHKITELVREIDRCIALLNR